MQLNLSAQKIAILIVIFAIILFTAGAGYSIYITNTKNYLAGSPPKELTQKIPAKQVPYNQIKPPALNPDDAFLIGSPSSTYGIIFYGDYTNPKSNELLKDLITALEPYGDLIRLNYRFLPKTTDEGDIGYETAIVSECSRLFGGNWIIHELLAQSDTKKLNKSSLRQMIQNASLEPEIISVCQYNTTIREQIGTAIDTAKGDGIDEAPFIFVGTEAIPASEATTEKVLNAVKSYVSNF
ncbi:MAG: hypothetical protein P1P90_06175 [Patescibacteria group bacterium]|nr:hypothetical protein [Patescibacteria group bacterium]